MILDKYTCELFSGKSVIQQNFTKLCIKSQDSCGKKSWLNFGNGFIEIMRSHASNRRMESGSISEEFLTLCGMVISGGKRHFNANRSLQNLFNRAVQATSFLLALHII